MDEMNNGIVNEEPVVMEAAPAADAATEAPARAEDAQAVPAQQPAAEPPAGYPPFPGSYPTAGATYPPEAVPADPYNVPEADPDDLRRAKTSKIMGIIACATCWLGLPGVIFGIIGLILSIKARKALPRGTTAAATAGMVTSIVGLSLGAIFLLYWGAVCAVVVGTLSYGSRYNYFIY